MLNIGSLLVSSLDYILIVDKNYRIVYSSRYDAVMNDQSKEYIERDILGKNFFDVYPAVEGRGSSIKTCRETQEIIINKKQEYHDYLGRRFVTNNITFPLMQKGELVAVVELAMDAFDDDESMAAMQNERFDDFVLKIKNDAGLITFDSILTDNKQMKAAIEKAKTLATLPNATLIYGETGTGKELFAQAMINYSQVSKKKVVVQNCAAVPENLMESILFGTVKGVFTGAENKNGLFEQADGGILFLDELNSVPYHVQSKLLRVLQDGTFRALGGTKDKKVNVKVIGAMNIDPIEAINQKVLRNDLFYRFSSGLINLLPLRERKEDIVLYVEYFVNYFSQLYNKPVGGLSNDVKKIFDQYPWEGNVRELKNTIESMIVTVEPDGILTEDMIPRYILDRCQAMTEDAGENGFGKAVENEILQEVSEVKSSLEEAGTIDYYKIMESVERDLIRSAFEKSGGNRTKAAEILGIPRNTLKYRMDKLNIKF